MLVTPDGITASVISSSAPITSSPVITLAEYMYIRSNLPSGFRNEKPALLMVFAVSVPIFAYLSAEHLWKA